VSADAAVGAPPGLEHDVVALPDGQGPVRVTCIDHGPGQAQQREIADMDAFLAARRPEWSAVRWINVDGLSNRGTRDQSHPLANVTYRYSPATQELPLDHWDVFIEDVHPGSGSSAWSSACF
jgi:hypothetical protein